LLFQRTPCPVLKRFESQRIFIKRQSGGHGVDYNGVEYNGVDYNERNISSLDRESTVSGDPSVAEHAQHACSFRMTSSFGRLSVKFVKNHYNNFAQHDFVFFRGSEPKPRTQ
jgi:hypothetical protein